MAHPHFGGPVTMATPEISESMIWLWVTDELWRDR